MRMNAVVGLWLPHKFNGTFSFVERIHQGSRRIDAIHETAIPVER
jgi:hypothetical protein